MGIFIILRSLNRAIFNRKLPLFYITEVERDYNDALGEYYNVKSKIYNNEEFKWEDNDTVLLLSKINPHMDDLNSFFEKWIDDLYDELMMKMYISITGKKKG